MPRLTHKRLLELLHYDPVSGVFTYRIDRPAGRNTRLAGEVAGNVNKVSGYVCIGLDGEQFYGHRLAWFYMTGAWPEDEVDHRDLVRSNNAWINLRPATKGQQRFNQAARVDNRSGFKGVSPTPEGRFKAKIKVAGRNINLGHFDTAELASAAYEAAAKTHAGEFARS
jgi:hypothetical protein